jgi:cytochrome c oxidase subunit 3
MGIAYGAMGMLFLSSLFIYLFMRYRAPEWPPPGMHLPGGLWLSTLLLLFSSATLHWAGVSVHRGNKTALKLAMVLTFALGGAFLVLQTINWAELWHLQASLDPATLAPRPYVESEYSIQPVGSISIPYSFTFYLLTGLHAAHVVGGVIWLGTATLAALRDYYTPARQSGMRALSLYWHFLDVVWVVLFATLLATT